MKVEAKIVTTPTVDTPGTAVQLVFANKRYMFGQMGEGLLRSCQVQDIKLAKLGDFFITGHTSWQNCGGLFGMLLSLADGAAHAKETLKDQTKINSTMVNRLQQAHPNLTFHGPQNLAHLLATARKFIFRRSLPIRVQEVGADKSTYDKPTFVDENIRVWAMSVKPEGSFRGSSSRPRKRTLDQFEEDIRDASSSPKPESSPEEAQKVRNLIIKEMFESKWSMEQMQEVPIKDVEEGVQMFVRNSETGKRQVYKGPRRGDPALEDENFMVMTRVPWPAALFKTIPYTEPSSEALSYIVRNHPSRGKMNKDRIKELDIPSKVLSKLTAGESVKNNKGETITPEMVLGEGSPGNGFAILDIPTQEHVAPLLSRDEWRDEQLMKGVGAFIWILGPGVSSHATLQSFMQDTPGEHIVSSPDHAGNRLSFDSAAWLSTQLKHIDPKRFDTPYFNNNIPPRLWQNNNKPPVTAPTLPSNIRLANRRQSLIVHPGLSLEVDDTKHQDDLETEDDASNAVSKISPKAIELNQTTHTKLQLLRGSLNKWESQTPRADSEIIALGTGSASPSRYRNVSGTLVRVPGVGNYLLDCGENTLGQLTRAIGPNELPKVLRDLRVIWISHMHADHHLGLVSMIKARRNALREHSGALGIAELPRLAVISEPAMLEWLAEYSQAEDFGYHDSVLPLTIADAVPNERVKLSSNLRRWPPAGFIPGKQEEFPSLGSSPPLDQSSYPEILGLSNIDSVAVNHCNGAKAVSMSFPVDPTDEERGITKPFKISYSGDCLPNLSFATIGRDSTVLIHEATFDDQMAADALAKKHSTLSQALYIGQQMQARFILLTHFSQRYTVPHDVDDTQTNFGSRPPSAQSTATSEKVAGSESEEPAVEVRDAEETDPMNPLDQEVDDVAESDPNAPIDLHSASSPPIRRVATIGPEKRKQLLAKQKVGLAQDYMRVRVGEFAELSLYFPALKALFEAEEENARKDAEREARKLDLEKEKEAKREKLLNKAKSQKKSGEQRRKERDQKRERKRRSLSQGSANKETVEEDKEKPQQEENTTSMEG